MSDFEDVSEEESTVSTSAQSSLEMQLSLEEFCDAQTPHNSVMMLQVLYNIHKRIEDHPTIDKYYRVYVKGDIFERHVWSLNGSEKYLQFTGWVKCGNYIILSKAYPVKRSVKVIEDVLKKKKKTQILYSNSAPSKTKKHDIAVRRARSNVGDSTIDEDEIFSTFTNINANETDSAIGSGFEDDDDVDVPRKHKLRRVESKEHIMGNEEYIVIDFIGNLEVSSRKSSQVDAPSSLSIETPALDVSAYEEIFTPTTEESGTHSAGSSSAASPSKEKPKIVFSAGGGLKQAKKAREEERRRKEIKNEAKSQATKVPTKPLHRNDSNRSTSPDSSYPQSTSPETLSQRSASPETTTTSQRSISPETVSTRSTSPETNDVLKRSSSNRGSLRDSPKQERSSSLRSSNNDIGKVGSLVMQNKLLFDQQIADGLKRKCPSTQSLNAPQRRSNLDLSNFEKSKVETSRSFNEKRSVGRTSTNDVDTSGMVAGALGIFGGGKLKSRPSSFQQKKSTDEENTKSRSNSGRNDDETYVQRRNKGDKADVQPAKDEDISANPLLSNYKSYDLDLNTSKKKRFPFKKNKASKHDDNQKGKKKDVELLSVKANVDGHEERAIDVPEDMLKTEEESPDKKKKGLFSRMRRSRKSSSDSDHERKLSVEVNFSHEQDKIDEKDEPNLTKYTNNVTMHDSIKSEANDASLPQTVNANINILITASPDLHREQTDDHSSLESDLQNTPTYSLDAASVLENIIDRKPSLNEEDSKGKKKRLGFKKKKRTSNVDKHADLIKLDKQIQDQKPSVKDQTTVASDVKEPVTDEVDAENITDGKKIDYSNVTPNADEEVVTAVIRTDRLIFDWSFDTEEIAEQIQSEIHATHEESIPEELSSDVKNLKKDVILEKPLEQRQHHNVPEIDMDILDTTDVSEQLIEQEFADETSSIATSELSASVNGGDDLVKMLDEVNNDDLVIMLDEANNRDNDSQSLQYSEDLSIHDHPDITMNDVEHEKGKKKKKNFRFPKMFKKDKQTKSFTSSVPEALDETSLHVPDKPSKKSKRPKSLEVQGDVFPSKSNSRSSSISLEDLENDVVDGKKKKLSFFRKKKTKSDSTSPNKEASFIAYTDNYPTTIQLYEEKDNETKNEATKMMVSSDEFTIPESDTSSSKPGHKEFIKNGGDLIEIKTSVAMEF